MDHPVTLRDILDHHAAARGAKPCVYYDDGTSWSYAEARHIARECAGALADLGVRAGDSVFTWLPNGPDHLRAWFGVNYLGAIHAPCNLSWRGPMLERAIACSEARVAVVHCDLLPRMAGIDLGVLEHIVVIGGEPTVAIPQTLWPAERLDGDPTLPDLSPVRPSDTMGLMFTSGTTGPSKGVLSSYIQAAAFLEPPYADAMGEGATFLLVLPLFHAGASVSAFAMLRSGGTLVIPQQFKTDRFWETVRRFGVTSTTLIEQMAAFLLGQPAGDDDTDNTLAHVNIAPMGRTAYAFAERFGVSLWTSYGSTEIGAPIASGPAPDRPRVTGRLRDGYSVRIVDAHDYDVEDGVIGELVIRADAPWAMLSGYRGGASSGLSEWRNGWFHSGDLFRRDGDGWYYFMDRAKDAIRRRGENISSYEVETEVLRYPGIAEVAAYAVPDPVSEDELMICIGGTGDDVAWTELVDYLRDNVPHYMVPRYFRRMDSLPRSENGKVLKNALREAGVTDDSWDREAQGIRIKAETIGAAR